MVVMGVWDVGKFGVVVVLIFQLIVVVILCLMFGMVGEQGVLDVWFSDDDNDDDDGVFLGIVGDLLLVRQIRGKLGDKVVCCSVCVMIRGGGGGGW